jgi:hypothetical protein
MKWLIRQSPQALVSFLLQDAVFAGEVDRELQAPSVTGDTLYRVTYRGEPIVLHVEFQTRHDPDMGKRLWEYNALTHIHTKLPVHSVVIYMLKAGKLVESPHVVWLPDGQPTQRLDFCSIKLWELDPAIFERPELVGLLPLLPLTKDSKKRETVTKVVAKLKKAGRQDLFMVGYALSELVFTAEGDREWLKASFFMQQDFIKNTWTFQHVREEGKEEGLQEGLERQIIRFIEFRFPALLELAKHTIAQKKSEEQLQMILDKFYLVSTLEEDQAALLAQ